MHLRLSTTKDINRILEIIAEAKGSLASQNINQWQDGYPTLAQIENDIRHHESFVIHDEHHAIMATFMFSRRREDSYATIEGQWLSEEGLGYGVIHRIAVSQSCAGQGVGTKIIQHCEQKLKEHGDSSMRIDTHQDNKAMRRVLEKLNYRYCGVVTLRRGTTRRAYEKLL